MEIRFIKGWLSGWGLTLTRTDLRRLDVQLVVSKRLVVMAAVVVVSAYVIRFWGEPVGTADVWGQFGDYIGGVLNPLIAGAAFFWVATSVKLQKEELAETRKALQDSHQAQKELAETSLKSAHVQSLNIQLSSLESRIASLRVRQNQLLDIASRDGVNKTIPMADGEHGMIKPQLIVLYEQIEAYEKVASELIGQVQEIQGTLQFSPYAIERK